MNIQVINADITTMEVDAIVNAANTSLLGGGGVDGAIHRKSGPEILAACRAVRNRQGNCPPGEAVITTAGNLPSKYVIHAVGPAWNDGNDGERHVLAQCYRTSLALAVTHEVRSIAFPNISTGIYRFPKTEAAKVAINTVLEFEAKQMLDDIWFVCIDEENLKIYQELI